MQTVHFKLGLKNAQAQFIVCRMKVNHQAALQARLDAIFHVFDLTRSAVARDNDLLALIHKRIERVEELFLSAVLARDELHIIDHQHIDRAEQAFEIHHLAFAQRLNKAVHKLFGREIDNIQIGTAFLKLPRDCVHQVGFTQANTAIKEQRAECDRATLGYTAGCGMSQLVRLANHKSVKGETLIQRGARKLALGFMHCWLRYVFLRLRI